MDGRALGMMSLMRSGRSCVLATMTMVVVMRVLVVVRDGVEFGAGRWGTVWKLYHTERVLTPGFAVARYGTYAL